MGEIRPRITYAHIAVRGNEAVCDAEINQYAFLFNDLEHAREAIKRQLIIQPCRECVKILEYDDLLS
jgi:hypothetical protein